MIYERAVRREFAHNAAGIFVALFAILFSTQLIRLLAEAAGGKLAPEAVLALLGFTALTSMPVLLSLTVFMAVLLSLSRLYRDSEMIVWCASGLPLTAWIRPVLVFALPAIVSVAALSLFLTPWAISQSESYMGKLDAQSETNQVSPGTFREVKNGERVVFVEGNSDTSNEVKNVFVSSQTPGTRGVVVATNGHRETASNGDIFMVLDKGRRYDIEPGSLEFKIMEFERYAVRVQVAETQRGIIPPKSMPLETLVKTPSNEARAELLWRIGLPLSAVVLALLAIPLSFVNPRAGRSANLFFALLVYVLYNNMLTVSQAWVAQGKVSFTLGWWPIHLSMLLVLPLLFYSRMAVFAIWKRRR
jgi:lipopolysaccharide export system permease protein